MSKVTIISDSTCDLSAELISRYGIIVVPMCVILGDQDFLDGVTISPDEAYKWADEHNATPKTAAINPETLREIFVKELNAGNEVVFFSISSLMSTSNNVGSALANELDPNRIKVVDSMNLSTGVGLSVIYAAELAAQGLSAQEIKKQCDEYKAFVRASFILSNIMYLYKGGRCSAVAAIGAAALNLKPTIIVSDGKMHPAAKIRGNLDKAVKKYIENMMDDLLKARTDRIFITHSGCPQEVIDIAYNIIDSLHRFKEILITRAGCTISCHCGYGTIGVLYVL